MILFQNGLFNFQIQVSLAIDGFLKISDLRITKPTALTSQNNVEFKCYLWFTLFSDQVIKNRDYQNEQNRINWSKDSKR
jgi:hypothetical protein